MSLINIAVRRDRGLVAADTLAVYGNGQPVTRTLGGIVHTPKIIALPSARCVIGHRGTGDILDALLHASHSLDSLDGNGLRELPEWLHSAMLRNGPLESQSATALKQELYAVGWSENEGCMVFARWWHEGTPEMRRQVMFVTGAQQVTSCMTHCLAREPFKPTPATVEELADFTRRSVELAREADPHLTAGGRLLVAEVTRDTIEQSGLLCRGHDDAELDRLDERHGR